ncbi:MAG: hypothetical protein ABW171_10735 [Steroidobacter sp.]
MKKVLLALASSLLASFATANPVTIDPDGLAEGTDLSTAFSGVTLRHLTTVTDANGSNVVVSNVYVKECPTTSDPNSTCSALGSGYFGYQTSTGAIAGGFNAESTASIACIINNSPSCRFWPPDVLDVSFDFAVQAVAIDSTHRSDWPYAWAFDAAGNRLQVELDITWHKQCGPGNPGNNFCHQTLTVTPVTGQISRVIFSGVGGFVSLDKLTYTLP